MTREIKKTCCPYHSRGGESYVTCRKGCLLLVEETICAAIEVVRNETREGDDLLCDAKDSLADALDSLTRSRIVKDCAALRQSLERAK